MLQLKKITYTFAIALLAVIAGIYFNAQALNIGLVVTATGRYIEFVQPLLESANKHFCRNHNVTYFIFTDGQAPQADNVVSIFQKRLGWPYDTMMRFEIYASHADAFKDMDYLFACDADMLFVDTVGDEILGDLVGTLHPGYVGSRGTYETNLRSTACIPSNQGTHYFAGGFNGGKTANYLAMANEITKNIHTDLDRGVIAIWHDESHLNRYFATNKPTVTLSPSYCYWQGKILPFTQRLVALNKDHAQYRR
ncbi:MAG: hypothetical protein NTX86_01285 [Candidatus Dependentiae bacterium]|nr:hypothetical protein [Candidatus Dependentiae bacterium]